MIKNLQKFQTPEGLTITAQESMPTPEVYVLSSVPDFERRNIRNMLSKKQWDYPHIWPPLEFQTVLGLLNYGYNNEARLMMQTYLASESKVFRRNIVNGEPLGFGEKRYAEMDSTGDKDFQYAHQKGFSWTCAVFDLFTQFLDKEN